MPAVQPGKITGSKANKFSRLRPYSSGEVNRNNNLTTHIRQWHFYIIAVADSAQSDEWCALSRPYWQACWANQAHIAMQYIAEALPLRFA